MTSLLNRYNFFLKFVAFKGKNIELKQYNDILYQITIKVIPIPVFSLKSFLRGVQEKLFWKVCRHSIYFSFVTDKNIDFRLLS